jgi:hypothetical protein
MILDECHWSGADNFNNFLLYIKNNVVDKMLGFSATPVRMADENKKRTLNIFSNNGDSYNILYMRNFMDAILSKDRLPIKWIPIPIQTKHIEDSTVEEIDTDTPIDTASLNENGMKECIKWLNDFIINSHWRKGILWFDTKKSLVNFYKLVISDTYRNLSNLKDIQYFPTFSGKYNDDSIKLLEINDNINKFKSQPNNAILLAVMRGTEGFDDKTVDFGFNFFLTKSSNPLLDQQKEGRTSRVHENKTIGYYGFLVSIDDNTESVTNIIVKRLGNWIKYIDEFTSQDSKDKENKENKEIDNNIKSSIDYLDQMIDINLIKSIDLEDIKDKIIAYSDEINSTSSIQQIKRYMQKINKIRQMNGQELIDTETKYNNYADNMNLPNKLDLSNYSSNWIKFLRHDYDQIVDNYIKESELICLLKKQSQILTPLLRR